MFVTFISAILVAQSGAPLSQTLISDESPAAEEVAFTELSAGDNREAIVRIEANDQLDADDPARLINLGIAHARLGDEATARDLFRAAAISEQRLNLQTATGEWRDSRVLAKSALRKLDRGEFSRSLAASK